MCRSPTPPPGSAMSSVTLATHASSPTIYYTASSSSPSSSISKSPTENVNSDDMKRTYTLSNVGTPLMSVSPNSAMHQSPGATMQITPSVNTELHPSTNIQGSPGSRMQITPGVNLEQSPTVNMQRLPGPGMHISPNTAMQQSTFIDLRLPGKKSTSSSGEESVPSETSKDTTKTTGKKSPKKSSKPKGKKKKKKKDRDDKGYGLEKLAGEETRRIREKTRKKLDTPLRVQLMEEQFFKYPLIENKYRVLKLCGQGASGVVCRAINVHTKEIVAIKRIPRVLSRVPVAIRILRELRLLRFLGGKTKNIVKLREILMPQNVHTFTDVFLVFDALDTDLDKVLATCCPLGKDHIKYIMWQLLNGVRTMHRHGVFHRDLKPSNILMDSKVNVKICDLGLARAEASNPPDFQHWTDYVATRWYRAPELVFAQFTKYSTAIDMWSIGAIFAEMLNQGTPLFRARSKREHLQMMFNVVGKPRPETLGKIKDYHDRRLLRELGDSNRQPFHRMFPGEEKEVYDLLEKLLAFAPEDRISADGALRHHYFDAYEKFHIDESLPSLLTDEDLDFEFKKTELNIHQVRAMIVQEIVHYHPEYHEWARDRLTSRFERSGQAENVGDQMDALQSTGANWQKKFSQPLETCRPRYEQSVSQFLLRNAPNQRAKRPREDGDSADIEAMDFHFSKILGVKQVTDDEV